MIRRHLTPSLIISLLALFIATSGTSYAVLQIPKKSVGTAQLKPNAVTSKKVKDGSLKAKDFKAGQLPTGATGAQGPTGPTGPAGPAAPPANIPAYRTPAYNTSPVLDVPFTAVATLQLPAGKYVVWSRVNLSAGPTPATNQVICSIGDDAAQNVNVDANKLVTITQVTTMSQNAAGAITLNCMRQSGGGTVTVRQRSITAIAVTEINQQ